MVLQDPSSQLAPKDLILMERRNQKQVGDDITGHSHWLKHMHRVGILAGVDVESRTEYLLFDCEPLVQISFTVFGLVSKEGGILQENMAGCVLGIVG